MSNILDALDHMADARALTDLIDMAVRQNPDEEARAIAAACMAIKAKLDACRGLISCGNVQVAA